MWLKCQADSIETLLDSANSASGPALAALDVWPMWRGATAPPRRMGDLRPAHHPSCAQHANLKSPRVPVVVDRVRLLRGGVRADIRPRRRPAGVSEMAAARRPHQRRGLGRSGRSGRLCSAFLFLQPKPPHDGVTVEVPELTRTCTHPSPRPQGPYRGRPERGGFQAVKAHVTGPKPWPWLRRAQFNLATSRAPGPEHWHIMKVFGQALHQGRLGIEFEVADRPGSGRYSVPIEIQPQSESRCYDSNHMKSIFHQRSAIVLPRHVRSPCLDPLPAHTGVW